MHIDDALEGYLLQLEADGRSAHTRGQYRRHIRLFAEWMRAEGRGADVADVDPEAIARFLIAPASQVRADGRAKRPSSMNALRSSLRGFFGYLHQAGLATLNPARLVRRARYNPGPPRALSVEEERRLLAALDAGEGQEAERDRVMFRLMLATGIRLGSTVALEVGDVDLDRRELRLRSVKGGGEEVVYLPSSLAPMLEGFIAGLGVGPLFRSGSGRRLSSRHVARRLGLWAEKAGIVRSVSPHALRHTTATRLYERTGDLLLVKRALRHRSISSTLVYARASDERLRAAIEDAGRDAGDLRADSAAHSTALT